MGAPTVTNTFSNGTTADATAINQNFTDLLNAMTNGASDFSIGALTVAGALAANGAVTLGNSTGDDVTVTGYLASSITPKSHAAYGLGGSSNMFSTIYGVTHYATTIAEASSTVGVTIDGALIKDGGITLSGGSTALNHNESGSFTVYCSDGTSVSAGGSAIYQRIGKLVSIYLPDLLLSAGSGTARYLTTNASGVVGSWPTNLQNSNIKYGFVAAQNSSTAQVSRILIQGGSVRFYSDIIGNAFSTSGDRGILSSNWVYTLD